LATIPNKLSAEYIDINLNDYQEFKYRIKTVTFDGIISDASKSAKARTHRIPFIVKGIKTTTNLPKTIKIKWQHINNKRTLSAYNIYGSDFRTGKYQHLDTIDIDDNTYSHELKKDGRIMYYKITTISNEGVETNLKLISATRGTTLRKPNAPIIKKSYSLNRKIHLSWKAGGPRTKYYYLYKQKIINGLLVDGENRTKLNASTTKIVDTSVKIGEKYRYTIQAIDKYDITSKKIVFKTLKVVIQ
jgi:fibronectin type 3 domain-containing protein